MGELNSASILCNSQGNSGEACRIPLLVSPPGSVFYTPWEDFHCVDGEVVITAGGVRDLRDGCVTDILAKSLQWLSSKGSSWIASISLYGSQARSGSAGSPLGLNLICECYDFVILWEAERSGVVFTRAYCRVMCLNTFVWRLFYTFTVADYKH